MADRFPQFADGDVRVLLTSSRQYQLHSSVLRNASPLLRELLAKKNAAQLSNKAIRANIAVRHRLVLVENPDREDDAHDIAYIFRQVPLDTMGRPSKKNTPGVVLDLENGRRPLPIFMAYANVLSAMYGQNLELGNSQEDGLAELLQNAFQATVVAEYLDCVRIISKPIEALLLGTGQNLYKAIADNPTAWLVFAFRVKSRAIFKEALIHAAGQFNSEHVQRSLQSGEIPPEVAEVLVRKGKWVVKTVSDSSRYLASYYPSMLLREIRPGDKDNVSRASYGNDIMMWIAVCIFRHWMCDLMASNRTHHAADCGWAFIDAVCKGGDTYLGREMLQRSFHTRFPMTGKGMACIEHRLAEVKDDIKQWAMPLKRSYSSLDLKKYPVKHFLHVNVLSTDYPWSDELPNDDDRLEPMPESDEESHDGDEKNADEDQNLNDEVMGQDDTLGSMDSDQQLNPELIRGPPLEMDDVDMNMLGLMGGPAFNSSGPVEDPQ